MKRQDPVIPLMSNPEVYDLQTNRVGVKRYIEGFSTGFSEEEDDQVKWKRQVILGLGKSCRDSSSICLNPANLVLFVKLAT